MVVPLLIEQTSFILWVLIKQMGANDSLNCCLAQKHEIISIDCGLWSGQVLQNMEFTWFLYNGMFPLVATVLRKRGGLLSD